LAAVYRTRGKGNKGEGAECGIGKGEGMIKIALPLRCGAVVSRWELIVTHIGMSQGPASGDVV